MELQRLAIIVGRMCRFMFMTRWLRPGAKAHHFISVSEQGGTQIEKEKHQELGEEGLLEEEVAGQISIGGES